MVFGIVIWVADRSSRQLHVAALYKFDNELLIGDLQWHHRASCRIATPKNNAFWIAPALNNVDQRILAGTLHAWIEKNGSNIPYSVAHPGGMVFRDNVWVGNEPGQGLTCATFIAELFKELGLPFIDVNTWEKRSEDNEWAERILGLLASCMDPIEVEAQRIRIGESIRVRPADVAAAGLLLTEDMETSMTFTQIAPTAKCVEEKLLSE